MLKEALEQVWQGFISCFISLAELKAAAAAPGLAKDPKDLLKALDLRS